MKRLIGIAVVIGGLGCGNPSESPGPDPAGSGSEATTPASSAVKVGLQYHGSVLLKRVKP